MSWWVGEMRMSWLHVQSMSANLVQVPRISGCLGVANNVWRTPRTTAMNKPQFCCKVESERFNVSQPINWYVDSCVSGILTIF